MAVSTLSPVEKRELFRELQEKNPDIADLIGICSNLFGKPKEVTIERAKQPGEGS